jgi:hypothetical protein
VVFTGLVAPAPGRADGGASRFGVALYAMPTNMALDDLGRQIAGLNIFTAAQNLAPIDRINWSAQFGMEGRYALNRHWTAVAGFGTIKAQSTSASCRRSASTSSCGRRSRPCR